MAIVKMDEFSLLVPSEYKENLLEEIQKFQLVEFIDMQNDEYINEYNLEEYEERDLENKISNELSKIKFVIEELKKVYKPQKGIKGFIEGKKILTFSETEKVYSEFDFESVYEDIKKRIDEIKKVESDIKSLQRENEDLSSYRNLDIKNEDLDGLVTVSHFLGDIPKALKNEFKEKLNSELSEYYLEYLSEDSQRVYFILIVSNEVKELIKDILKSYGFSAFSINGLNTPSEIISKNLKQIEDSKNQIDKMKEEIKNNSKHLETFEILSDYLEDNLKRVKSSKNFLKGDVIFFIKGWVPEESSKKLEKIANNSTKNNYYIEFKEAEPDSADVPIMLKNNKVSAPFEDVTSMYAMPKYNEIDPTPLFTPFYLLFFGLMMADIGYGLVLLVGTTLLTKYVHLNEGTKKFMGFLFWLSFPTIAAGALYGSFFGITLSFYTPLLNNATDIMKIMILSISLGVVHLFYGLGIKAYLLIRDKKYLDAVFDVGCIMLALIGAILLLVSFMGALPSSYGNIGKWIAIIGVAGMVLTNGRDQKNIFAKLGVGLYSVYGLTSYLGDSLSYTRVLALSLSGAYIGSTFNMLAGMVSGLKILNIPIGFVLFLVIVILGHVINFGLNVLSAYVHTCRLQYVEFFSKFYEGGGKTFKPLKFENNYIEIKNEE